MNRLLEIELVAVGVGEFAKPFSPLHPPGRIQKSYAL
jgi:hypothetical protein